MKKAAGLLRKLTVSVCRPRWGNKENDGNQGDAKTEQSQNAKNSKDNE